MQYGHRLEVLLDTGLLRQELKWTEGQGSMHDAEGAVEVIAGMCSPEIGDRYIGLNQVLDDLAIVDA